jgi:hypothetical protein
MAFSEVEAAAEASMLLAAGRLLQSRVSVGLS